MNPLVLAPLLLTLVLAGANGSNDVSKGVATLAGAGVTRYRVAILWGVVTTLAGSLLSLTFATRLTRLFSAGIVSAPPTPSFAVAVLIGAIAWVGFATAARWPVSTTHAIVGALIGAGLELAPGAVHWAVLSEGVAIPLLASVVVAYLLSAGLNSLRSGVPECTCADVVSAAPIVLGSPPAAALSSAIPLPIVTVTTGTEAACRVHRRDPMRITITRTGAHWLTSGATSFARGLNDTPKIVALGLVGGPTLGLDSSTLFGAVAMAIAVGGLVGGMRVARVLGEKVVRMSPNEGFKANLTTALLVGIGAHLGLPMSTTHVATGAIGGAAGTKMSRLNQRLLRDVVLAWAVTSLVAGVIAASAFALLSASLHG